MPGVCRDVCTLVDIPCQVCAGMCVHLLIYHAKHARCVPGCVYTCRYTMQGVCRDVCTLVDIPCKVCAGMCVLLLIYHARCVPGCVPGCVYTDILSIG